MKYFVQYRYFRPQNYEISQHWGDSSYNIYSWQLCSNPVVCDISASTCKLHHFAIASELQCLECFTFITFIIISWNYVAYVYSVTCVLIAIKYILVAYICHYFSLITVQFDSVQFTQQGSSAGCKTEWCLNLGLYLVVAKVNVLFGTQRNYWRICVHAFTIVV